MISKLRPYLRSIYRTLVIWIGEAFGLLLLIYFVPGLSVNSIYDPTNDEVAAFEELIGSHRGWVVPRVSHSRCIPPNGV